MPLHLLGKKSWNVYNQENIARVRKDQAAAKLQEEEEERRQRDDDAGSRLQILRGQDEPNAAEAQVSPARRSPEQSRENRGHKRRRIAGENDTDRDIRVAQEQHIQNAPKSEPSIVDVKGNINLVPVSKGSQRKPDTDSKESQFQQGISLADAAGSRHQDRNPWYISQDAENRQYEPVTRDVWGNEDPRRRVRETQRLNANDPLMAMKRGVKQLRTYETQRDEWRAQREKDLHEVEYLARKHRHKRRRSGRGGSSVDSLDGFDLDGDNDNNQKGDQVENEGRSEGRDRHKHAHSSHRRRRHRSRSPRRYEHSRGHGERRS